MLGFGFHTKMAENGWEAVKEIKYADSHQRPYGPVLMDWKMPEFDGLQAVREINNEVSLSRPPVILMVTAYSAAELEEVAGDLPLNGVLVKPINPSALLDTTLRALGKQGFLPSGNIPLLTATSRDAIETIKGSRILVAEDNEINQELIIELLTEAGILYELAENGQEALDWLDKQTFDAVLMDVHMPVMDGFTATHRIREDGRFNKLPIIATTANALAGDRQRCLDAGMSDYLSKPIHIQQLLMTLVKAITGQAISLIQTEKTSDLENLLAEEKLPVISSVDMKAGLMVANYNMKLYRRLLKKFIRNETFQQEFIEALNRGEIIIAERMAHTLKGSAGNIGATKIQVLAAELQNLCAENVAMDNIMTVLHVLQTELDSVITSLKEFDNYEADAQGNTQCLDNKTLKKHIDSLMMLLQENDTEAGESFSAVQTELVERGFEEVNELMKMIDDYDFEAAIELLAKIKTLVSKQDA